MRHIDFQQKSNKTGKNLLSAEETKRLGLDRPITRRDFIKVITVGAASLMVPGCSGLTPDPTFDQNSRPNPTSPSGNVYSGGNTEDARSDCHQVRDGRHFSRGQNLLAKYMTWLWLAPGWEDSLQRISITMKDGMRKFYSLDNHADFGGDAQRNELTVKGQRIIVTQGCDYQWKIDPEYRL